MSKNPVTLALIIPLMTFAVSCASSGIPKPTVFVDQYNSIPADIPSQFLARYERFVTGKESKEFKKLLTDEERQAFIDKFWLERDTDPSTSENERKQEIDGRIDDIADERFFSVSGTAGLLFRSNGGFRGDMAHVYLLYGEPDAMDTLEGNSFVPLMLWLYGNSENGSILYAFLFYQKDSGGGPFKLFSQDSYQMDRCAAIYEVATLRAYNYSLVGGMQSCPEDLYQVFNEIFSASGKGGILDGRFFTWALFNFSQYSSITQGETLEPPETVPELARQSKARVTGEAPRLTGVAGTDYILASCKECNSFIPAEFQLGKELTLSVRRSDIDWHVAGDQADVELKARIVFESQGRKPLIFKSTVTFKDRKDLVVSDPAGRVSISLLNLDEIPAGTYRVSVYVKNVTPGLMTKKYNAWDKEFVKP